MSKTEGEKKDTSGSLVGTLLVLFLLSVIAGGMGFISGNRLKQNLTEPATEPIKPAAIVEAKTEKSETLHFLSLPTVVVNLADGGGKWVRMELSVLVADEKPVGGSLAGQLAEDVVALMRSLSVAQISGPSGFQHLREDLLDRLKLRSGGRVREATIQALVIE